jgi:hypothetical protein
MARLASGTVNHPAHEALQRAASIPHAQLTGHPVPAQAPIRPHPQHPRQGEHQR